MGEPGRLIVAADIFGRNGPFVSLARELGADDVVDPYGGAARAFADEAAAHAAFLAAGGLPAYAACLAETLRLAGEGARLLGFSAGGAAVWLAACDPALPLPRLAVCVYAGQIRHHADLAPRCPCRLIFPRQEEHFDVAALAGRLRTAPRTTVETAPFRHGFMNPLSLNFDAQGCARWTARLAELLAAEGRDTP